MDIALPDKKRQKIAPVDISFLLPPSFTGERRIIIAGLDPPANSRPDRQHDNFTSKQLIKKLGHHLFDWIDFSKRRKNPLSPESFDRECYYA